ncbi:FHIPEP family type III secretion protein [Bacillus licheniformis]|nr:FHIPEP family type III secretion protein [Bacillus licheniformis]
MSIQEAASHFTLLSVGDGIVSQLPALLISTATGIVVTRAASDGNLGHDITGQLFAYPKLCMSRRERFSCSGFHADRHSPDRPSGSSSRRRRLYALQSR